MRFESDFLLRITSDHRERKSGLIELLEDQDAAVEIEQLPYCDYLINNDVSIERKTAHDFIISIIDGRLFRQAWNLLTYCSRPIFLIEGNPFATDLKMDRNAIRGALISVQSTWNIPIIHSRSINDTCDILLMIGRQSEIHPETLTLRHGYRPKRLKSKQLYVLQGLPGVGPVMAKRLLDHFKSVSNVFKASNNELLEVEGVGDAIIKRIRAVID